MAYSRLQKRFFWLITAGGGLTVVLLFSGFSNIRDRFKSLNSSCSCLPDAGYMAYITDSSNLWFIIGAGIILSLLGIGFIKGLAMVIRAIILSHRIRVIIRKYRADIGSFEAMKNIRHNLKIENKLIFIHSCAPYAFCFGFINPRIVLSMALLKKMTPVELKAVILHEKTHLESYQPLKMLIIEFISSVLFFLPIFKKIAKIYRTTIELAADEGAPENDLSKALIKLVNESSISYASGVLGFSTLINERLRRLTDKNYKFKINLGAFQLAATLVFIIAFIGIVFIGKKPAEAHQACEHQQHVSCYKQFIERQFCAESPCQYWQPQTMTERKADGLGEQDTKWSQLEKLENETISRRDDEGVSGDTSRRSNEEIGHFPASRRAGEFGQSSLSLVACVSPDTHRSSLRESCLNSLRSIDSSSYPALLGYVKNITSLIDYRLK